MRLLAIISSLAMLAAGSAHAQDCARENAKLGSFLRSEGLLSVTKFRRLDDGEKWYFTANMLLGQTARLTDLMESGAPLGNGDFVREKRAFRFLDAAEPCYRTQEAEPYFLFVDMPGEDARAAFRTRLEEFQ